MAIALVAGQSAHVAYGNTATSPQSVVLTNNPAAGNLVIVLAGWGSSTVPTGFALKDANNNTYAATTKTPFTGNSQGCGVYYLKNTPANALKTVNATWTANAAATDLFILEFSGADTVSPFENDATALKVTGSTYTTTPTYTPLANGELLVSAAGSNGTISGATSPWIAAAGIPTAEGEGGEYTIQTTAGAQDIKYTLSVNGTGAAIIAAFKAAAAAAAVLWGFQPQETERVPLYAPTRRWRTGAILRGDDGTQAQYQMWRNAGWEVQPVQPPRPRWERRGAALQTFNRGGTGKFEQWRNTGWEVPPPQPPHPRRERSGAIARGNDGIEGLYSGVVIAPPAWGWEIPPPHIKTTISRSNQRYAVRGSSGFAFYPPWFNLGWEVLPFQPPHPKPERAAAFMIGDAGIQAIYIPSIIAPPAWDFNPPIFQPPHPRSERSGALMRGDDGTQNQYQMWRNAGFEVQPFQPPHRGVEKKGAILRGDDGTQAQFVNWANAGWEVAPALAYHIRRERLAAILRGDDGTQAQFIDWKNLGGEVQPFQPRHPRPERAGAIARGDAGVDALFTAVIIAPPAWGWEIQAFQPSHPRPERSGALARGDDGLEASFIQWFNGGWEVQPFQPPHPRPERAASWLRGDDGIQGLYSFIAVTPPSWGWESSSPILRYAVRNRGAALDGFVGFVAFDSLPWWEMPTFQPPHPRPERAGAIARGDDGTQDRYQMWRNAGLEVQPFQPPRPRWERRGAILRGDDGTQDRYQMWRNAGWEVLPFQPPHRGVERHGAILFGNPGIDFPYIFVPPAFVPLRLRTLVGTGL